MANNRSETSADNRATGYQMDDDFIEIILDRTGKDGLGFNIRGGYDMPHMPNDDGVFVTKIRENGAAALDGRLHEGDKILTINDQSLEGLSHRTAVELFKNSGTKVHLKVQRNAERKIKEATGKSVNPKPTQQTSKPAIFIGIGATLLLAFALYKCRHSIKGLFSHVKSSGSKHISGLIPISPAYR